MALWANATITNKGYALQAKLLSTDALEITRVVSGSGRAIAGHLINQTDVSDIQQTLAVESLSYDDKGNAKLRVLLSNKGLSATYTCNQIGIYANDPDEGEILYAIAQEATAGQTIPSIIEQPYGYDCGWVFTLTFSNSENVSVTIDPTNALTIEIADERYPKKEETVGRLMAGKSVPTPTGETLTASDGAEIFNDYREVIYSGNGNISTGNIATGSYASVRGSGNAAKGNYSAADGRNNVADGTCAYAGGYFNTAAPYQFVVGKYSTPMAGAIGRDDQTANNTLFMVGCGTTTAPANAFRISTDGRCRGIAAFLSSGADFAEYFEWLDGNPNGEDRRGRIVTLDGDKIRLANADDDYILGVVSGTGAFIGNSSSEHWHGMYLTDVYGEPLTEQVEVPETLDEGTGEIIEAHTETRFVVNPEYNPAQEYTSREFRKEWSPVGFHGQLVVEDDSTCEVNSYCKPSENGIATASESGYRVMSRLDDNHIKVLVR